MIFVDVGAFALWHFEAQDALLLAPGITIHGEYLSRYHFRCLVCFTLTDSDASFSLADISDEVDLD